LHQPCPCGYENTRVRSRILRQKVASFCREANNSLLSNGLNAILGAGVAGQR
jgi:hypothetical protein